MTQDEIIRMAREAGIGCINGTLLVDIEQSSASELERFAALVAAHEREKCFGAAMKAAEKAVDTALLLEREACAKLVENWEFNAQSLVRAIRART